MNASSVYVKGTYEVVQAVEVARQARQVYCTLWYWASVNRSKSHSKAQLPILPYPARSWSGNWHEYVVVVVGKQVL